MYALAKQYNIQFKTHCCLSLSKVNVSVVSYSCTFRVIHLATHTSFMSGEEGWGKTTLSNILNSGCSTHF